MNAAIDQFRINLSHVRNLTAVSDVAKKAVASLDITDVFRSQIVLAVSALDHYVHHVSRLGALEVFVGKRPKTDAFVRARVEMQGVLVALTVPTSTAWFEQELRREFGWQSFQAPDKIADAVRIFSNVQLWKRVGKLMGKDPETLKGQLRLMIDRRNKIAH